MKKSWILFAALLLPACKNTPSQPLPPDSHIVAYVHWANQPLAGKKVELVETGDTKLTDSHGQASFSVPPGKYILRAFDINRGGPAYLIVDFTVDAASGDTTKVDIFDCLPCV